jgi:hypothetical protein
MSSERGKSGYGITIFKPQTPRRVKIRKLTFLVIFCFILLIQVFYWVFANRVEPVLLGMPFGMFYIVLFIGIEFIMLVILYFIESKEIKD